VPSREFGLLLHIAQWQAKHLARLGGGCRLVVHLPQHSNHALGELQVGCKFTLPEIEVVLQPDTHDAHAEQQSLDSASRHHAPGRRGRRLDGGMQTLQWGVSHPDMMDSLVALTPMARTSAWSIAANQATRQALTLDPAFKDGNYTEEPVAGLRARAAVSVLDTRTPNAMRQQFTSPLDLLPWIQGQEDALVRSGADANDWIAQSWAYDRHNVGDTLVDGKPIYGGDPIRALHAIEAKALLMSGELDLYNPIGKGIEAASAIPDGRHVTILSVQGHVAASAGFKPADLEFINATVRSFMADVTNRWKEVQQAAATNKLPDAGAARECDRLDRTQCSTI
jgi:pimeloyl-ACP methyl ester carboxylesterase